VFSNVPFVLVAGKWIGNFAQPELMWKVMALATTLAGNLTPVVWSSYLIALPAIGLGIFLGLKIDRRLNPASLERLELTEKGFERLCQQVEKRLEQVLAQYSA
jgi:hypothetical protein